MKVYTRQSKFNIQDVFLTLSTLSKLISSKVMIPMQNRDPGVFVDSSIGGFFCLFFLGLLKENTDIFVLVSNREFSDSSIYVNEISCI